MTSSQLYISIHSIYLRDNEFPSLEKISKETGVKISVIKEALNYYLIKGKLNIKNGIYTFPLTEKRQNIMNLILRIIMGIVGLGCLITSIKFTYSFNKLTMPKFWAFVLSASLMIFTSFCFTVRESLKKTNRKQSRLYVVFYFIGIFYSVFTAVAGQYNDYLLNNKITAENKVEESAQLKRFELLSEQKERYLIQIEDYKLQLSAQQKIINNLSESPERKFEYNNTWKQTIASAEEYNSKISDLQNKISEIDEKLISSIEISEKKTKNIFDWISDLLHINSSMLQFLISLFPAIFIDLVSPFAISFAFNKNN